MYQTLNTGCSGNNSIAPGASTILSKLRMLLNACQCVTDLFYHWIYMFRRLCFWRVVPIPMKAEQVNISLGISQNSLRISYTPILVAEHRFNCYPLTIFELISLILDTCKYRIDHSKTYSVCWFPTRTSNDARRKNQQREKSSKERGIPWRLKPVVQQQGHHVRGVQAEPKELGR